MSLVLTAYMSIVTAAVIAGGALSGLLDQRPRTARFAVALSAGVMLAVCLLYLIPDALAFQHGLVTPRDAGNNHLSIGYALSLGFLSLLTIERYLLRAHGHAHDHAAEASAAPAEGAAQHDCRRDHQPPHHHQHATMGQQHDLGVTGSTVVALWLHGLFDGVALYAAGVMPTMGPALAMAIILHKVPESATLFTVLRRGKVPPRSRKTASIIYLASTPLGMLLSVKLLVVLPENAVAILMAFVAGSLLHLVTGHLLPEATAHDEPGRNGAYAMMLGGFFALLLARVLGAG